MIPCKQKYFMGQNLWLQSRGFRRIPSSISTSTRQVDEDEGGREWCSHQGWWEITTITGGQVGDNWLTAGPRGRACRLQVHASVGVRLVTSFLRLPQRFQESSHKSLARGRGGIPGWCEGANQSGPPVSSHFISHLRKKKKELLQKNDKRNWNTALKKKKFKHSNTFECSWEKFKFLYRKSGGVVVAPSRSVSIFNYMFL